MSRPVIIMVAPNGARRTHKDHPALPVSIAETAAEAANCFAAGATVLHAHVRGDEQQHLLDSGLYRELIAETKRAAPQILIQITTEAVGVYNPQQQVDCVQSVKPEMASVALKEMTSNYTDLEFAGGFYHWAEEETVHIQHILYSADDLGHFLRLKAKGIIPDSQRCVLFVLGRYSVNFQSDPVDLSPFIDSDLSALDWFVCAFGAREQDCVLSAIEHGGHARIGFENNLYLANGELAQSTSELVSALLEKMENYQTVAASVEQTRQLLGLKKL